MLKHLFKLTVVVLFACYLSACQTQSLEENPAAMGLQAEEVEEEEGCEQEGLLMEFNLNTHPYPQNLPFNHNSLVVSHVYLGQVPSYSLGEDCMCTLTHYGITFDKTPTPHNLSVYNHFGGEIAYNGPYQSLTGNGSEYYIEISGFHLFQDVYVGFNSNIEPLPELIRAGGLCMIDNVSLPKEPMLRTTAYEQEIHTPSGEYLGVSIYVPNNHGVPASFPLF